MARGFIRQHIPEVRCMAFATSTKVLVTGGYDYNLFVTHPAWREEGEVVADVLRTVDGNHCMIWGNFVEHIFLERNHPPILRMVYEIGLQMTFFCGRCRGEQALHADMHWSAKPGNIPTKTNWIANYWCLPDVFLHVLKILSSSQFSNLKQGQCNM